MNKPVQEQEGRKLRIVTFEGCSSKKHSMAKARGAIVVDVERCKGCQVCMVNCPADTIGMTDEVNGKGYHYAYMKDPESCTGCTNCAIVCPDGVITVYRVKNQ